MKTGDEDDEEADEDDEEADQDDKETDGRKKKHAGEKRANSEKRKSHGKKVNFDGKVKNRKPNKIMWKSIVKIKFTADDPLKVFYKYNYEEEYRESNFRNKCPETRKKDKHIITEDMMKKYKKPRGINALKKQDLLKLCEKEYIAKSHHSFYKDLTVNSEEKKLKTLIGQINKNKKTKTDSFYL